MMESDDWSGRLVRLKFEMMASALLLVAFAFASQHIHTSIIFPIDIEGVGPIWLFVVTSVFYWYTAFHFFVRYRSELPKIHNLFGRTEHILQRMEDAKFEFREASDAVNLSTLSQRLDVIKSQCTNLEDAIDRSAEGYAAAEKRFMEVFEAYSSFNSRPPDDHHLVDDAARNLNNAKEQWRRSAGVPTLEGMKSDVADLKELAERHEAAISEGIPQAVKRANDELREAVSDLRKLQKDFSAGRNAAGLDRVWLASILPAAISLLMAIAASIKFAADRDWFCC